MNAQREGTKKGERRGMKEKETVGCRTEVSKSIFSLAAKDSRRFHQALLTKFRDSFRSSMDGGKGNASANTSNPPKAFFTVTKSKAIVWNGSHLNSQSFVSPAI